MKRIIYILICAVSLIVLHSCINDDIDMEMPGAEGDYITLDFSSNKFLRTRSVVANELESKVEHLDVLIFEENGTYKYSERIHVNASSGNVRLNTKRRGVFGEGDEYYVFVIANSTLPEGDFSSLADIDALRGLKQVDERIHMTGSAVDNTPQSFLMDGVALIPTSNEEQDKLDGLTPKSVILYNGNDTEKTSLKVYLRRAAAKVVVELKKGNDVSFISNEHIGYYLRNMPYNTAVIPLANSTDNPNAELRTPDKATGEYFQWSSNKITVTSYLYEHVWDATNVFNRGTSLVVNIPMNYNGTEFGNNYYQIALRPKEDLSFKRNNQYLITGTINAPGAEEVSEPVIVDVLEYEVCEWEEVPVEVNGENAPSYLTVNRDTIRLHNVDLDESTLKFASSSDVTVKVLDNNDNYPYYIDKFGQKTKAIVNGISGQASGIVGNIKVESPVPTNNTIRYFMLEISNEENLKDTVWVEQYPLIYITNQQGWYSYRDDFKNTNVNPTTYEYKGDRIVGISLTATNSWISSEWTGNYSYSTSSSGFWRSKVAYPLENGMSNIYYYSWRENSNNVSESSAESGGNARMYHVRVTSTSETYNVGRPRMTAEGYTDPGDDNSKLVSPSFMIASRLGFINSSAGNINTANTDEERIRLYNNHCANYVEVYKDKNGNKVELRDWRLPTEAELKIIMELQGTGANADAIDYLLNAANYISASGPVSNKNNSTTGTAGRCVRDAYEK